MQSQKINMYVQRIALRVLWMIAITRNHLLEVFSSFPCERNLYKNTFLLLFISISIGCVEEYFHQIGGAEQALVILRSKICG